MHLFLESFPGSWTATKPPSYLPPPLLPIPLVRPFGTKREALLPSALLCPTLLYASRQEPSAVFLSFCPSSSSHTSFTLFLLLLAGQLYNENNTALFTLPLNSLPTASISLSPSFSLTTRRGTEQQNPTRLCYSSRLCLFIISFNITTSRNLWSCVTSINVY